MSAFSIRRYLPYIDIVSKKILSIFPNAIDSGKYCTTAQQMAQKPYERFVNPELNSHLSSQYQNLLLDERSFKRCSYARSIVAKRNSKAGKSSDSLVMRRNRRSRTVFTSEQVAELEYYFMQCNYVNSERADELAAKLSLGSAPVRYWFKNQRRRLKVKQSLEKPGESTPSAALSLFCKGLHIPTVTPPPTPTLMPPSADVVSPYTINVSFTNQVPYSPSFAPASHLPSQATQHQEPVFNLNDIQYFTPTSTEDTNSLTRVSNNSDTSDYFSQMSPNSEINEPLTPNSVQGDTESVFNDLLDSLQTPKEPQPSIESIYEKLTSAPEPNFNGAYTILHSYDGNAGLTNSTRFLDCLELA